MAATVVLLNGVGSAGKSSIARSLQSIASHPFLHVEMDTFLDMLPERYHDHPDGLVFESTAGTGGSTVAIRTGPVAARALRGMRSAVAAMAKQGNDLIVDDVMLGEELAEYVALLADTTLHTVGVHAPLEVLEVRERQRGDRLVGLARWQFDRVHQGKIYDLDIDTSAATPEACAEQIRAAFGL